MDRRGKTFRCLRLVLAVGLLAVAGSVASQEPPEPKYFARFADGTNVANEPVRDWHDVNATPRIGNNALFDPNRPVRWLVRMDRPADATPTAFVEFVGGDRMPGEVVAYSSGAETPYRRLPPYFVVQPAAAFRRPNTEFDPPVRIEAGHVRRVVWQAATGEPAAANTAVFRDGRRLAFRAVRWEETAIALLLEDGVQTIPFSDLAEVRLAAGDPWQTYFDHAATVLPSGDGRLLQVETTDGLVALASTQRLRAETYGDNRRPDHWYQVLQPAWSLDPFWVRFSSIRAWRCFPPERVPATLLDPGVTRSNVVFSAAKRPLTNRSSGGKSLGDGAALYGWGFATHAPAELDFVLPQGTSAFHTLFGLDPAAGPGGAAKVRIDLKSPAGPQKLYESDPLVSTSPARDPGRLSLPADAAGRRLVLVSDPLYEGRPTGADPFDIRDAVNWYVPEVELDAPYVKTELRRRAVSRLPGLTGWEVDPETADFATVVNRWDTRDWEDPRFRSFAFVEAGYLAMSRKLRVRPEDRYLAVYAHCPHDDFRPARIQVRFDGKVLGEQAVLNEHGRREPDPLLFAVREYAGRTVAAEVIQLPGAINEPKPAGVDWRGAELVSHRPGVRALFEDDPEFAGVLTGGDGLASADADEHQTGAASLNVTLPGVESPGIPGWNLPITEDPDLGEYRFLRFAWKTPGAGPVALAVGHDGRFGPGLDGTDPPRRFRRRPGKSDDRGLKNGFRYVAGKVPDNDPELTPSVRVDGNPPKDWQVVQRDLFGDFGGFNFTGLGLLTREGPLSIDGIYLARAQHEFRFVEEDLKGEPSPLPGGDANVALKSWEPRALPAIVAAFAPGFGLAGQGGELQLLKEYRGRQNVMRTHPEGGEEKQAVRLTMVVRPPADRKSRLAFSVSQHGTNENDQKDWDLQVFANGRELLARRIDRGATNLGWLDLGVDLAEFAGKPVRLELRHKANGWDSEFAYWSDVRIVTE